MNFLALVMFSVLVLAHGVLMEKLDDLLIHPRAHHKIITKRQAPELKAPAPIAKKQKEFYEFVEDKLIQHSQALEHLVKLVDEAVSALNNLADNMGRNVEEPKLPEKIEAGAENFERSGDGEESRRSYWGKPLKWSSLSFNKSASNAWCSVAVLCHRTGKTVCGYDDAFGYGKFDDLCHLIQVNCYWSYNFALVPNCRSSF